MALDLHKTAGQIRDMAAYLKQRYSGWEDHLRKGLASLEESDPETLEQKRQASADTFRWQAGSIIDGLAERIDPTVTPANHTVISVDGSHIDVDRHTPARCYLINIGMCRLSYGQNPDASLSSHPTLYAREEDLVFTDPTSGLNHTNIQGPLLGLQRAVAEVKALDSIVKTLPGKDPVLALLDGSLILWSLFGQGPPEFIRKQLLVEGLLPALDGLRSTASVRQVVLAAYISLPRAMDIVNLLRLHHCPFEKGYCDLYCRTITPGKRGCDPVDGLLDRDLFASHLAIGQRSPVFSTASPIVREYYGDHCVHFFYINTGEEIGRVEIPAWVAKNPQSLALAHSLILDQCRKGEGYPVALSEAHEQAVVTGADRQYFAHLVDEALENARLPVSISQKSRSKRTRWI